MVNSEPRVQRQSTEKEKTISTTATQNWGKTGMVQILMNGKPVAAHILTTYSISLSDSMGHERTLLVPCNSTVEVASTWTKKGNASTTYLAKNIIDLATNKRKSEAWRVTRSSLASGQIAVRFGPVNLSGCTTDRRQIVSLVELDTFWFTIIALFGKQFSQKKKKKKFSWT